MLSVLFSRYITSSNDHKATRAVYHYNSLLHYLVLLIMLMVIGQKGET